jgi:hypothetical protein
MLSIEKTPNSKPVAIEKKNNQLIYYKKNENHSRLETQTEYEPWFFGDALVYVCGRRGSGKSTYCNIYIKNYVEATDGRVFLISRFEVDPSINLPERGMFIPIAQIENISMEDMKDSLIVFDDIHSAQLTPQQTKKLHSFILDVMENSRHFNLSSLITSHMITNYSKTRAILNECSAIVIFPAFSNNYQIERALKVYFGLTNEQISKIMNVKNSRWVQVQTVQPKFILSQKEIYTY